MKLSARYRNCTSCLQIFLGACVAFFVGCVNPEPEDPGYNKPAVSGIMSGEIHSVDAYFDAVRKENERRIRTEGDVWSNPEDF